MKKQISTTLFGILFRAPSNNTVDQDQKIPRLTVKWPRHILDAYWGIKISVWSVRAQIQPSGWHNTRSKFCGRNLIFDSCNVNLTCVIGQVDLYVSCIPVFNGCQTAIIVHVRFVGPMGPFFDLFIEHVTWTLC